MLTSRTARLATLFAGLFMVFSLTAVDYAEARRGGSFGSRGSRTFQSAPATRTAPQPSAPVERSMTPNTNPRQNANPAAGNRQTPAAQRPGLFGGLGGTLLGGLMLGGLIGMFMGQGFGGLAGMFGMLLQLLLIGGAIMLAMRFFRSRNGAPAMAGAGGAAAGAPAGFGRPDTHQREAANVSSFKIPNINSGSGFGSGAGAAAAPTVKTEEIQPTGEDLDTFQRMLTEVQEAFGREDHRALRRLVTPEMVSYLSEELAENAQNGVRNDVTDVHLLQADIAEGWREGDRDYATAALHYSSIDVTRDRATGDVVDGNPNEPTETTELWTFVRQNDGEWQLSAIQQG